MNERVINPSTAIASSESVSFYELFLFIKRWKLLFLVSSLIGATLGLSYSFFAPLYFEDHYVIDADASNVRVMHDPNKVNPVLGNVLGQVEYAQLFTKTFFENFEKAKPEDKVQEFMNELSDSLGAKAKNLVINGKRVENFTVRERAEVAFMSQLLGPVSANLKVGMERPLKSQNFQFHVKSVEGSWDIVFRSSVRGVGVVAGKSTSEALNLVAKTYNDFQYRDREKLKLNQMESAKTQFLKVKEDWLSKTLLDDKKRFALKWDFYNAEHRLKALDRSKLAKTVEPTSILLNSNDTFANESVYMENAFNSMVKELVSVSEQGTLSRDGIDLLKEKLTGVYASLSTQKASEDSLKKAMSAAHNAFTSAIAGNFTNVDTASYFLPGANFDENYILAQSVGDSFLEKPLYLGKTRSIIAGFGLGMLIALGIALFLQSSRRRDPRWETR